MLKQAPERRASMIDILSKCLARTGAVGLLLLAVSAWPVSAHADQKDPRLTGLFKELQATKDSARGGQLARRIWAIWYSHASPKVGELLRDGDTLMQRRAFGMAEKTFTEIITKDPTYAEGWNRRATVRFFSGNYPGSISDIKETLAREPRHFGALSGLGLVYIRLKRYRQAIAAFEAALKVNPHMPQVRRNIGRLKRLIKASEI